jgi:hypothetical protein
VNKKFNIGDTVFSPFTGFGKIDPLKHPEYAFSVKGEKYLEDGRYTDECEYPMLLTLEEAEKLGYHPPKKKVKKTANVYLYLSRDWSSSEPKAMAVYASIREDDAHVPGHVKMLGGPYTLEYEIEE